MRLIPDSEGRPVAEGNAKHEPAGSSKGGQFAKGSSVTLHRGVNVGNRNSSMQYYSTDHEWARQFTQSGQDHEIHSVTVTAADIYEPAQLPSAMDEDQITAAIADARAKGFKAIRVDEGRGQPNSVLVFNKTMRLVRVPHVARP